MKAILISEHGGVDVLKYTEVDTPAPEAAEILIKVAATTAAYADTRMRAGNYPMIPPLPFIPGFQASGIVSEIGDDVPNHWLGQQLSTDVS
jgi:NADPH2:quinone reductase